MKKLSFNVEILNELAWEYEVMRRIDKANVKPNNTSSLKDIMGEQEYKEYRAMNVDQIPDDELFEK